MTTLEALKRIENCRINKSETLDLSNLGLTKIPTEISDFDWLKSLNLSSNQISQIVGLDKLT